MLGDAPHRLASLQSWERRVTGLHLASTGWTPIGHLKNATQSTAIHRDPRRSKLVLLVYPLCRRLPASLQSWERRVTGLHLASTSWTPIGHLKNATQSTAIHRELRRS